MTWQVVTAAKELTVAKYALDAERDEQTRHAVEQTLEQARGITTELLSSREGDVGLEPGDLRRERPAAVLAHARHG